MKYPEYIRVAGHTYQFYVPSRLVRFRGALYRLALQLPQREDGAPALTPEEEEVQVATSMVKKCLPQHTTIGPRKKVFCVYQPDGNTTNFLGRHSTYEEAMIHARALLFRLRYFGRPLDAAVHTAVIRECEPKDRDKSRPATDQVWCLFTKDGKQIKGRHPTHDDAVAQEAAIHSRGASLLYRGAKYVRVS